MKTWLRAYADSDDPDHERIVQSDQGRHYPRTESLATTDCMNGEQKPVWYIANTQDGLNLRIVRMFESTFRLTRPIYYVLVLWEYWTILYMNRVKRKITFIHDAQNVQIQIIMRTVSSGPFLPNDTFCSTQWFH